jgi:3-oxoadipate enol-lactonase
MSFVQLRSGVHHCELRPALPGARGPALLLVNALGTSTRLWDGLLGSLEFRGAVLGYDKRGHGLSERGEAPYTVEALAGDALELLEAFGLDSVVVCGLSVGGLVAQELAARAPARVRCLVLCGTAARIGTPEGWQTRIDQVQAGGVGAIVDVVLARWFAPSLRARAPELERGYRCMLERADTAGYLATLHALRDADLTEQTARLRLPALVVSGELDEATTAADGRRLAASIAGARFELLAGAAHLLSVERPRELARLVDVFMAELGHG